MPPYTLQQIGNRAVRFPSGAPIPDVTDISVDPYWRTRQTKGAQVEALHFFPQEKTKFPSIVLLHEAWGLNTQIKDLGARLACEGFSVLIPNLYGRVGGMVTANREVAEALMQRVNEADQLVDINSCCEFLNVQDSAKRNAHGVVGFGMGGSLALRFACSRKRLKAAVAFYSRVTAPPEVLKSLYCPILYHRAGADAAVTDAEIERLRQGGKDSGKPVDIRTYPDAPHGFCDESRRDSHRHEPAAQAWAATIAFLQECFKGI